MSKSNAQLQAELAAALEAVKMLKAQVGRRLTFKRSEKGCVCISGLQRHPVSLYPNQWKKIAEIMPELMAFIDANFTEAEITRTKKDEAA